MGIKTDPTKKFLIKKKERPGSSKLPFLIEKVSTENVGSKLELLIKKMSTLFYFACVCVGSFKKTGGSLKK